MNTKLNKSVKKFLDDYLKDEKKNSPEHHESVMLIMRGALTDANFHSEAKQLGKYFPKAGKKFIGTPMEDVIESKGIAIAKAAKYDGHDIIDAFAFYLSMSIGGSFGHRLMSLKESIEESLVKEGDQLDEKNVPTDASKWSYYKAQAKKKFDVYPSAYANGWAAKQYKKAGGGWKSESVKEGMVSPSRGHAYYKLSKDTPIKYVSGHYGVGLKVPGVLLHNEYDIIKGQKGAYIINYFNSHFYVDIKNKFASRIAHPDNKEQNKDLKKNMQFSAVAPDHKDWKRFVKESVNEAYGEFIKAKNLTDIIKLSKQKKNATFYVTDDNNSRIGAFYLKNGKFAKVTSANANYDLQNSKTKLRDRSDVIYKYKVDESVNEGTKPKFKVGDIVKYKGAKVSAKVLKVMPTNWENGYLIQFQDNKKKEEAGESSLVKESVNEAKDKVFVVMFKDKKDLPNKNIKPSSAVYAKEADAKKFLKSVEKDGGKGMIVKSNKPVGVKVNEAATRTAMEIGGLTGMNKDAIQKFVDDNNLDIEKVYQFVKKGKLADRMKLVSAIAGKPNNPVQKKMVKQFGEGIIREAKVRLGKDSVNFKVMGDSKGLTLIAASGNDLDGLQDAIDNDVDVKGELRKTLEKQLKVPVEIDGGYDGAGFRFNIDFYSLAKKVK